VGGNPRRGGSGAHATAVESSCTTTGAGEGRWRSGSCGTEPRNEQFLPNAAVLVSSSLLEVLNVD
jgi:hypothetical protein